MNERVLVAVDLSPASDAALRAADTRVRQTGGRLAVCHVVPNPMRSTPLFPQLAEYLAFSLPILRRHAAAAVIERVATTIGRSDGEFELLIEDGLPHVGIVSAAAAWDASLVVVASHGSGSGHIMLGRVADRVIRAAHCPVLVVRSVARLGPVLVATDFSDPALPAVSAAVQEASRLGVRLAIVHSVDLTLSATDAPELLAGGSPSVVPESLTAHLRHEAGKMLRAALARHHAEGEIIVAVGPPAPVIVQTAARISAALIVVGTLGRTGLARLVLGSVAESVIRDASCSVLVVRLANG